MSIILFIAGFVIALNTAQPEFVKSQIKPRIIYIDHRNSDVAIPLGMKCDNTCEMK